MDNKNTNTTNIRPVVDCPDINSPAQSFASVIHPNSCCINGCESVRLCDLRSFNSTNDDDDYLEKKQRLFN